MTIGLLYRDALMRLSPLLATELDRLVAVLQRLITKVDGGSA